MMALPMTEHLGLDVPRFLALLRARLWLIVGMVLAAVLLALAVSLAQADRYRASAVLQFGQPSIADTVLTNGAGGSGAATPEQQSTNLALASLDSVAARVKQRLRGPVSAADLKNAVSVSLRGNSDLLTVTAEWSTPRQAAILANAFAGEIVALRRQAAQTQVQRAIDAVNATIRARETAPAGTQATSSAELRSLRSRLAQLEVLKVLQTGNVQIVERATPPAARSSPRPVRNAVIAGIAGLILSIFVVVLLARYDERIRDEDELAELMSARVLARIPEVARSKGLNPTGSTDQNPAFVEAFEFLRLNLEFMRPQEGHLVVAVTSPADGDGKTTVVAWLAQTLSNSAEVVAVDFDLRNPMLHSYFDVPQEPGRGVVDALLERPGHNDLAQPTRWSQLRVLPAGHQSAPPPGLIAHERLRHLLEHLRDSADYVIVDTSPVSAVADASAVGAAADGVILVVDLARSRRKDLVAAKKQLANARTTILGIVINRAPAEVPSYYARERTRVATNGKPPPAFTA